ncbi:AhpC/TSA family protein [Echinicola soli]|uniref:AhpC/TSA family protein n=1 Tax=Echinicola soli TaxID=2591634 RepID=A0A514CFR2_9BACT|nr:TlpA disulfide reductase family protein [Echinicola soli]QDH78648.1 AhpC/TSA family protein [Echinicola soli]
MHRVFFILILAASIISPSFAQDGGYTIDGKFDVDYEGFVYLHYDGKVDSALVQENGFSFSGKVPYVMEAYFTANTRMTNGDFYLENSEMKVLLGRTDEITFISDVKGCHTLKEMEKLGRFYEKSSEGPDFHRDLYQWVLELVKADPRSQFSGMLVAALISNEQYDLQDVNDLVTAMDTTTQVAATMREIRLTMGRRSTAWVGNALLPLRFPDDSGKVRSTTEFSGQYLLVTFWASNCGYCRKENPAMVKVYEKYHAKGLEVFGVSVDSQREQWLAAIKEDQLPWVDTLAEGGINHPDIKSLGIYFIPSNYLLDPSGIIIGVNLSPEELDRQLASIMSDISPEQSITLN